MKSPRQNTKEEKEGDKVRIWGNSTLKKLEEDEKQASIDKPS